MNTTTSQPEISAAARRWKWVERSFTLAAMAMVVWLSWSALSGMTNLFTSDTTASMLNYGAESNSEPEHAYSAMPANLLAISDGGYWQMAGWKWEVGISNVDDAEIDARLQLDSRSRVVPIEFSSHEQRAMDRIIHALQHLEVERVSLGDLNESLNEYRVDQRRQKLRVFTRGEDDQEVLISIAAAFREKTEGAWKLLELRSQPTEVIQTDSASAYLMPLPAGSRKVCARSDSHDQTLFEVAECSTDFETMIANWKAAGWQIDAMLPGRLDGKTHLCIKGDLAVNVWSVPSSDPSVHQVAFMRLSANPAEMKSKNVNRHQVTQREEP